ncbi:class F sortase [Streptomyces sp. NPDC002851]
MPEQSGRTLSIAIGTLTTVALCVGSWLLALGTSDHAPPQPSRAQAAERPASHRSAARQEPPVPALPPSPPARLRIASLGVDAPMTGLRLQADGSLEAPPAERRNLAGWYEAGTTPGARGTAIVAGHVDNAEGPAVFYDLGALRKGRAIEVDRVDGRTAVFTVDAVEAYDSRAFPNDKVYGAASRPELRVITCGGGFSNKTGYLGNVVVFAHLTATR